ncbi:hypothetical protein DYB28_015127 [Aphanomyces astaci]|uniref:Peptidase S1 domain-containing protein n=1 Tax=Aphanomyces astaci TaxID=112090 RepID=A0A9X8H5Y7_APHAT|nr:hypothetical protein DYB28_015127 [Aphanomyces astaci]
MLPSVIHQSSFTMKVAFAFSVLVTSVTAQLRIVGGKEAAVGKHLYVTGLRSSASGRTSCGGSLIAPNVVLTAAHCMKVRVNYVAIGSHYNSGTMDGEQIKVKQAIKHPKYNEMTYSYDIGVLILELDSKFPAVEVSFDTVAADTTTVVRGWGTTSTRVYVQCLVGKLPHLDPGTTSAPGPTKPTTTPNITTKKPTTASPYTTSAPGPTKPTTMPNMTTMRPTTAYPKPGCATCGVCYYPGADYCLDDFSKDYCEYYIPEYGTLWCGN